METTAEDTPSRTAKERHEKRIERLRDLVESGVVETARKKRKLLWQPDPKTEAVPWIAVRSALFKITEDHPVRTRIQQVSSSKSAAVQVLLLALFELQVSPPRPKGWNTRLPIRYSDNPLIPSWVDFTALPTVDSTKTTTHARIPRANRERQIKRALDRLAASGRVELKPKGVHGRYENFGVLDEGTNQGPGNGTTYYAPPNLGTGKNRRLVVTIPVEFFLNGWIDALSDNEIITYLALRQTAQAYPGRHDNEGIYLTQAKRTEDFNLDRGFEAHRMLARYGLINTIRDFRRSANGTMSGFEESGPGQIDRFTLNDSALAQPAFSRVMKSLQQFANGFDSDLAGLTESIELFTTAMADTQD
ncbi:hypothetical protein G7043_39900 [Lentzea sp. NEAU-D13]|uniref:Uncharacterized protein n=1 Tax=Lentzea alba TaxID=2714351 RepID=A0A7C9VUS6_9PSEU|nr:hypothetical protein [Lentzea alba]NGY65094.1 hypothetical protein [Lentzea alba]